MYPWYRDPALILEPISWRLIASSIVSFHSPANLHEDDSACIFDEKFSNWAFEVGLGLCV